MIEALLNLIFFFIIDIMGGGFKGVSFKAHLKFHTNLKVM